MCRYALRDYQNPRFSELEFARLAPAPGEITATNARQLFYGSLMPGIGFAQARQLELMRI